MFQKYFIILLCALNLQRGQRCKLNSRDDFHEPLPIVLRNGNLLEPDEASGNVILEYGDMLTLSCEGAGNLYHPNSKVPLSTATLTCESEDLFTNNDWLESPSRFSQFRCVMPPNYFSKRSNRSCFEGNVIFEVGYNIQNNFYPVYESCFNEGTLNVLYSKYTQKSFNSVFETRVDRPFFIANDVYRKNPVETLFSPRGQKAAVGQLVGSMIDTYINDKNFLSRGHLAAKTDFVFAFGQRASFHYVNCAPQWYGFNSGNWNTLEVELRNRIHSAGYDTIIYTGTYGVSSLKDHYGRSVDIYLYSDENNNPVIPIPMYYYKVVYDPSLGVGTAFVGINNPHYTLDEAKEFFFCTDVCRGNRDFSWLPWKPDNPTAGFSFCCTVPDFRRTVHHLPQFEVRGLLT